MQVGLFMKKTTHSNNGNISKDEAKSRRQIVEFKLMFYINLLI